MDSFLPDSIKALLGSALVIAFVLNRAAPAFPHIRWLQYFRLPTAELTKVERDRRRRAGNRHAGLEMAGFGLILPVLYFASTVILFNEPGALELVIVGLISLAFVALGIWLFVRNLR